MAIPLIYPLGVAALSGAAYWRMRRKNYGMMTPERKELYKKLLADQKDPAKLQEAAEGFEKGGLKAEADELRKRAKFIAAPPAVKQAYETTLRKALGSTDPQKVSTVAKAFQKVGLYGTADKLRNYASGLVPLKPAGVKYGDMPMGPAGQPPKTAPVGSAMAAAARASAAARAAVPAKKPAVKVAVKAKTPPVKKVTRGIAKAVSGIFRG